VTGSSETINGTPYTTGATYDDAGDLLTQTYPDGEVLTTSYTAEGWFSSLATTFPSGVNGGAMVTLLDHLSYTGAAGARGLRAAVAAEFPPHTHLRG
jgi:hypothetical protein